MHKKYFLLITLLSILFSACASNTPVITSTELNIYAFSEYIPESLITAFESETGVRVNYDVYASNEEMFAGLASNPAFFDLINPSDYAVENLIGRNALLPLELNKIPNYANLDPSFLNLYFDPANNEKYSIPYLWGTTGILYDTSKVSPPITSWADLWRPELAGHIVVLDDSREMMGIALLVLGYDKNETDPARLAEARDKLNELAKGIIAFDAEAPEDYITSGEAWVAVVYNGNAALAQRVNPALSYVLPVEGAGFWIDNMAIPVDAPHADAALAFINFVLTPKNGAILVQEFPYSTPNMEALDYLKTNNTDFYNSYIENLASNPSEEALSNAQIVKRVDDNTASLYDEYWLDVKLSE